LKNRWLCLKEELRVKNPTYAAEIIKACAYLHNFIIDHRTEAENDDDEFIENLIGEDDQVAELDQNNHVGNNRFNTLFHAFNFVNQGL